MNEMFKIICAILLIILFLYRENTKLKLADYVIKIDKLPSGLDFKIVHLSDIHNTLFGKENKRLVQMIEKEKPNVVVITGDLINRRKYDTANALPLLKQLVTIANVYYVTGNHEWWSGKYKQLKKEIESTGVTILSDEKEPIRYNNKVLNLVGIDDPAKYYEEGTNPDKGYRIVSEKIDNLLEDIETNQITILLSHRPELFDLYKEKTIDLVLCGHAHGGQIRLPFIGGVLAPNQGFFPKYDGGVYQANEMHMIVNRGLGNSLAFRVFNKPEVGVIRLK